MIFDLVCAIDGFMVEMGRGRGKAMSCKSCRKNEVLTAFRYMDGRTFVMCILTLDYENNH